MIAVHSHHLASPATREGGFLDSWRLRLSRIHAAASDWVWQTLCGARGHAMLLRFESTRLSLQCMSCRRTTPGWTIHDHR